MARLWWLQAPRLNNFPLFPRRLLAAGDTGPSETHNFPGANVYAAILRRRPLPLRTVSDRPGVSKIYSVEVKTTWLKKSVLLKPSCGMPTSP